MDKLREKWGWKKCFKTLLIFTFVYDFVDTFSVLVPACNLLRYLIKYLQVFIFHLYNLPH